MEIEYHGKQMSCVITRRKMKNMRVRVKEDGIIYVSAPHDVPDSFIRRFLLEHAAELAEMTEKAVMQRAAANDHSDGSQHHWLGGRITLRWLDAPRPATLENNVLSLFARSQEEAETAFRQWKIAECIALCKELNREVYHAYHSKGYAVPLAHIQIKEMTSRWGSCTPSTGRLSINFRLMQYPKECIYGVFCHEYAHFLHQDHSSAFYEALISVFPEYRQWDAVLKAPLR